MEGSARPEPQRVLLGEAPAHEAAVAEDEHFALAPLAAPLEHLVRVWSGRVVGSSHVCKRVSR